MRKGDIAQNQLFAVFAFFFFAAFAWSFYSFETASIPFVEGTGHASGVTRGGKENPGGKNPPGS